MAGQMQHLKGTVPKINDITFVYISGQRRGGYGKCLAVEIAMPVRTYKINLCPSALEQHRITPTRSKGFGFKLMAQPAVKFMQAAAMIEMRMGGDGLKRLVGRVRNVLLKRVEPHAGVNHQIAITALNVPDVAAHKIGHTSFLDTAHPGRNRHRHKAHRHTKYKRVF